MGYDTSEIYQSTSEHLKADDIRADFWTSTINGVGIKDFEDGSRKLIVSFSAIISHATGQLIANNKSLVLNKTNSDMISNMYGTNTDGWFGRQIMLFSMPVKFQDKMVNAIRVREPAQQQSMPVHHTPRMPGQLQPGQPAPHQTPAHLQNSSQRPLQPAQGYSETNPPPISADDIPF